ncbi:MAG TPA: septum formation initiator family protein [Acidimicrobiia bacterium]|nr:septum formation initiator family protein [Acidimicrobiia bacterium]
MTLLRRPGALVSTLLILLMGAAFFTQVVPYGQIVDSRRQVTEARDQLSDLEAENAALQADVEALQTPGEIEKLAREKLGYVRPGETAFVVLDPPGTEEGAVGTDTSDEPAEEKTWVDRVWEFLSGADMD